VTILGRGDLAPPRRSRHRRWPRALLALVVLGALGAGAWYGYDRWIDDEGGKDSVATPCVTPSHPPAPAAAKDVTLWVLNGTKRVGLAHDAAKDLRARGFRVTKVANASSRAVRTTVSYATGDRAAGLAVAEQLPDPAAALGDGGAKRLALILGPDYRGLTSTAAAAAHHDADVEAANPPPPACAGSEQPE
jgi:hypothetical protein